MRRHFCLLALHRCHPTQPNSCANWGGGRSVIRQLLTSGQYVAVGSNDGTLLRYVRQQVFGSVDGPNQSMAGYLWKAGHAFVVSLHGQPTLCCCLPAAVCHSPHIANIQVQPARE